jgi:hypothetical protein
MSTSHPVAADAHFFRSRLLIFLRVVNQFTVAVAQRRHRGLVKAQRQGAVGVSAGRNIPRHVEAGMIVMRQKSGRVCNAYSHS